MSMNKGGFYPTSNLASTDIFWNMSALITQRFVQQKGSVVPNIEDNHVWMVTTAITILGFLAYRLLIDSWLRSENFISGPAKTAFDDTLRFTTMFAIMQILSGGSLLNSEWAKSTGLFVGSLVFYDLLADPFVTKFAGKHFEKKPNVVSAIKDVAKFGCAFTAFNFMTNGKFDKQWLISTAGYLSGVAIYDLLLAQYLVGKDGVYNYDITQEEALQLEMAHHEKSM